MQKVLTLKAWHGGQAMSKKMRDVINGRPQRALAGYLLDALEFQT